MVGKWLSATPQRHTLAAHAGLQKHTGGLRPVDKPEQGTATPLLRCSRAVAKVLGTGATSVGWAEPRNPAAGALPRRDTPLRA
jgi:hypothetical protein